MKYIFNNKSSILFLSILFLSQCAGISYYPQTGQGYNNMVTSSQRHFQFVCFTEISPWAMPGEIVKPNEVQKQKDRVEQTMIYEIKKQLSPAYFHDIELSDTVQNQLKSELLYTIAQLDSINSECAQYINYSPESDCLKYKWNFISSIKLPPKLASVGNDSYYTIFIYIKGRYKTRKKLIRDQWATIIGNTFSGEGDMYWLIICNKKIIFYDKWDRNCSPVVYSIPRYVTVIFHYYKKDYRKFRKEQRKQRGKTK